MPHHNVGEASEAAKSIIKGPARGAYCLVLRQPLAEDLLRRGDFQPAPEHTDTGLQGMLSFAIAETGKEQMR